MTSVNRLPENPYPTRPILDRRPLPDPLSPPDGKRIATAAEWPAAAGEWARCMLGALYGPLPPASETLEVELLCHQILGLLPGSPANLTYRAHCRTADRILSFPFRVYLPAGESPCPAIIVGDACWSDPGEEVIAHVLEAGYALVSFNRTDFAEDQGSPEHTIRSKVLPKGYLEDKPQSLRAFSGLSDFGAISAWAWGFHRCVDAIEQLPCLDARRLAVTGHSRGGKAALVAGLTDRRIAAINANGSGAAGAALSYYVGDGGESLRAVRCAFPSWFARARAMEELPGFDQHCLLAAIAPRPLLATLALDDRWSNPEGMVLSVQAARRVYAFLGAEDNIAFHSREGTHSHDLRDWQALVHFLQWKWEGVNKAHLFNNHPYTHLPAVEGLL